MSTMDRDLAKHVASVTIRAISQLGELVPLLKEHCDAAEYEPYLKAIATVSAVASTEMLNKVFSSHPDIEREFEAKISKYGRVI